MKSRIEYLTRLIREVNERMDALGRVDPRGYRDAVADYNRLAGERTWLSEIEYFIPMVIEHDQWEELHGDITIKLITAARNFVTPFNDVRYAPDQPQAALMDVIRVPQLNTQFTYAPSVVRKINPRHIAGDLTRKYLYADDKMTDLMEGIRFADIALSYMEMRDRTGLLITENPILNRAINLQSVSKNEKVALVETAIPKDEYLADLYLKAKGYALTMTKLIALTLHSGRFKVEWEPFVNSDTAYERY